VTDPARQPVVDVVGGGLAGSEAAWQLARRGVSVRLHEMKPERFSPAHVSPDLGELVCSNSLRSDQPQHAVGLLHDELRRLGSLVMWAADQHRVPAGRALAVDRVQFSQAITRRIEAEPRIELVRKEVTELPPGLAIVASGPLTSDALAVRIAPLCGTSLYFYDSISPTVYCDSLDHDVLFRASRWEDGEGDYLNSPLDREQYYSFVDDLRSADKIPLPEFEKPLYFESCLPIEVMAERGVDTLAHGPLRPVGFALPASGKRPFAVVQLRQEDKQGTLYNLVGFQTRMRIGEQKRVLRKLPGLENAVFARFGSVHRNTFIRAPELLDSHLQHRARPGLYFAGQIAGVEGYVESTALGLLAGIHVAFAAGGAQAPLPPETTALAALLRHLREGSFANFQPMNINFGLFPPLLGQGRRMRRHERNAALRERALRELEPYAGAVGSGTLT
jgi:methylenetetrahydrofolate--tRNA-(uracil-5-)-methyltransferase